jgi:hypothetical protein
MNFIFIIFLIAIGLLTFGIRPTFGQQKYTDQEFYEAQKENKAVRPKSKFKFRKKRHIKKIDFEKVDTNAVYITMYLDSSYSYIRFFKGAVFESGPYKSRPNGQELENLNYGVWRCYKMTRKGLIIIEKPKRAQMDSRWIYFYGNITTDKIELTHYYMSFPPIGTSPGYLQTPATFNKQAVHFKNRKYEWKSTKASH